MNQEILSNGIADLLLIVALICGAIGTTFVIYLTILLGAAALSVRRSRIRQAALISPPNRRLPRFGIVIPAYNEEEVLRDTLQSLLLQNYQRDAFEIVVIADNCTDTTAEIAESCGVTVLTRTNRDERGKGYALAWAFSYLLARPGDRTDAWAIIDADTTVATDFLATMADYITSNRLGSRYALQGRYGVLNRTQGWRTALMSAAFDLFNHVRPLGADKLGFLVGLKGNGMVFSRETLSTVAWQGHSITEDIDYGLDLLRAGIRIHYVPDAVVQAQMPVTAKDAASQRARWEMGRFQLVKEKTFPLLREAFQRRQPILAEASLSLSVPPLADLTTLTVLGGISLGVATRLHPSPIAHLIPATTLLLGVVAVGLPLYILCGLRIAGAGKEAYIALLRAPFYAFWKLALYVTTKGKKRQGPATAQPEWIRTTRIAVSPTTLATETRINSANKEVSEVAR